VYGLDRIAYRSFWGRVLRFPLRLIPPGATLRILQGPLKGKRWIVGSGVHGYWLGSYEYAKQKRFEEVVRANQVVFDIGAHVGFYTLLAAVLVGPQGRVVAFEPLPRNLIYLQAHLALNRVTNVTVIEAAVSDRQGVSLFDEGADGFTGHISTGTRGVEVPTVTLDELVWHGVVPRPDCIKIDTEGAEASVLAGAEQVLATYHPVVFLATHGGVLHEQCTEFLRRLGYCLEPVLREMSIESTDEILAVWEGSLDRQEEVSRNGGAPTDACE
jgi:FkbM family methyltransferase